MADTVLGYWEDRSCDDCGDKGTVAMHSGPMSPDGQWYHFCADCWSTRVKAYHRNEPPQPIGWRGSPIPQE